MKILYSEDLDGWLHLGCSEPGCSEPHGENIPVFIQQTCHPGELKDISYCEGIIHIECVACGRSLAHIKVESKKQLSLA